MAEGRELPSGAEWLYKIWNEIRSDDGNIFQPKSANGRVERASIQSLVLLDLARCTPSGDVLPTRYIQHASGRLYAQGHLNLQSCVRELRRAALKGCFDIDIENCHWTILSQLAIRSNVRLPHIDKYLANKKAMRQELAAALEVSIDEAKFVLLALIYGARLSPSKPGKPTAVELRIGAKAFTRACHNQSLITLKKEIDHAKKVVIKDATEQSSKRGRVINAAGHQASSRQNPGKLLAHILQGAESAILRTCGSHCKDIVLLQHDGFTSKERVDVDALSSLVKEKNGYEINFTQEEL